MENPLVRINFKKDECTINNLIKVLKQFENQNLPIRLYNQENDVDYPIHCIEFTDSAYDGQVIAMIK